MKRIIKYITLLCVGGAIYLGIETLYRGETHISMFLVGGLCFVAVGLINNIISWDMPFFVQMLIGMLIITGIEFVSGCILNLWLKLDVWSYANMPLNILGQICIPFMGIWFLLSAPAIIVDDYMRYWLFNEAKPHYTLFLWRKSQ